MYNIWLKKQENKLYHVLFKVEEHILISREGKIHLFKEEEFYLDFEKTNYSEEIVELKTEYLNEFNFATIQEYEDYLEKIKML